MKKIKIGVIVIFSLLLILPIIFLNTQENYISEIDNRKLEELPKISEMRKNFDEYKVKLETYIDDRIGFRNEFIEYYTLLNDKLFNKMVHPTYTYGKDGNVFMKINRSSWDYEFLEEFAQLVKKMQTYCEERNTPFVFAIEPSKARIYTEYLPKGVNLNTKGIDWLTNRLEELNINFVDNTDLLREKSKTEQIYNVKYDAGHWNDLGAFYGTNNILKKVEESFPNVKGNKWEDMILSEETIDSLPNSNFKINETVPVLNLKPSKEYSLESEKYVDEIKIDKNHSHFAYIKNLQEKTKESPKTLVFQGSYYNTRHKFLQGQLRDYIAVHNYENVINLDYYFNIFKPECVIFEVADYTIQSSYFNYDNMKNKVFNPSLNSFKNLETKVLNSKPKVDIKQGETLCDININEVDKDIKYAYLEVDGKVYDMSINEDNNLSVTIENTNIKEDSKINLSIISSDLKTKTIYKDI